MTGLLTAAEEAVLHDYAKCGSSILQRRAHTLLLYGQGLPTLEVSRQGGLSPSRSRYWKQQFILHRLEIFPSSPAIASECSVPATPVIASERPVEAKQSPPSEGVASSVREVHRPPRNDISSPEISSPDLSSPADLASSSKPHKKRKKHKGQPAPNDLAAPVETQKELYPAQAAPDLAPANLADPSKPHKKRKKRKGQPAPNDLAASVEPQKELYPAQAAPDLAPAELAAPVETQNITLLPADNLASAPSPQPISFPEPLEKPGLLADDPFAEAGRKTWLFQFAQMLANEEGTRLGEDIEALHDMRVATRRMRAAFEVFGPAFDPKALKPHLNGLRTTGRQLGRVRDLDVFLEKAHLYLANLPAGQQEGLAPLLAGFQDEREAARLTLLAHLASEKYLNFKTRFNNFLHTPGQGAAALIDEQGLPLPARVCDVAPPMIYARLGAVRAYAAILETASLPQLHALRIEFKKFRYTLEFFREVLGSESKGIIDEVKTMQDHLGDLNDAEIACQVINRFLQEWDATLPTLPLEQRINLEPVVGYLAYHHTERHRLLTTFPAAWEHFNRPELRQELSRAVSVF